jgi:hypothetical protein
VPSKSTTPLTARIGTVDAAVLRVVAEREGKSPSAIIANLVRKFLTLDNPEAPNEPHDP